MSYLQYQGEMKCPEEKKEELRYRIRTILDEGGMFAFDSVELMDVHITLLRSPRQFQDHSTVTVSYNSIEDNAWWDFRIDLDSFKLQTNGDSGRKQFLMVCLAVFLLCELYDENGGFSYVNNDAYDARKTLQWLNYLFDECFSNQRMVDPWEMYENRPNQMFHDELYNIITKEDVRRLSSSSLLSYLYVKDSEMFLRFARRMEDEQKQEQADPDKEPTISIFALLNAAYDKMPELKKLAESQPDPRAFLANALVRAKNNIKEPREDPPFPYWLSFMLLPLPVLAKMIADAFSWNFWEFYKEVKAQIPDDSRVRECWDKPDPFPAEPKLSTQDFLRYRDDDRIWWWKPGCSLQFSDSQKAWFQRWKQVLNKYAKAPAADASIVIQQFLALIYDMEYGDGNSIYLFETLFYDFLTSASAPMTQAAIRYLEEQWKSYKAHHRDRQYTLIRRYIAALANRDFRQEFLGF